MKKVTKTQKRQLLKDKWFNRIFLVGMILFFAFATWFAFNSYFRYDIYQSRMLKDLENKKLESQQICMFRNQLIMEAASSIEIDGQTYYACCPGCAEKLKNNYQESQFAIDEYSHHRIRKTKAFIILNNKSTRKVSYFESEKNYNQFINSKSKNENKNH